MLMLRSAVGSRQGGVAPRARRGLRPARELAWSRPHRATGSGLAGERSSLPRFEGKRAACLPGTLTPREGFAADFRNARLRPRDDRTLTLKRGASRFTGLDAARS